LKESEWNDVSSIRLFLTIFKKKLREFSAQEPKPSDLAAGVPLQYSIDDLNKCVSLLHKCKDDSKLFNTLTSFCLILLVPPAPFLNKTISTENYVEKLIKEAKEGDFSNLLFASIIASVNECAIKAIIDQGQIEKVVANIESHVHQCT